MQTLFLKNLELYKSGKVREVYYLDKNLLMVASDRISAFDVIMNELIPDKGKILNQISIFWFEKLSNIIKNHLISTNIDDIPKIDENEKEYLKNRFMIVKKTKVFPIECVVRNYLAGSAWKEYQLKRSICGNMLPDGLVEFSRLPEPIFTPATKKDTLHDENITFDEVIKIIGKDNAEYLKNKSFEITKFATEYLMDRGIILADTKFEFGLDLETNEIILIDEVLTPDSSRFWLKENYKEGQSQYNFDKQILRDYLLSLNWNKQAPAPKLPLSIITATLEKYKEAFFRITGKEFNSN